MSTMPDSTRPRKGVVGGIDTHADVHVAAALDQLGALIATCSFTADPAGYARLHDWLAGHGPVVGVGIEGTGSYGAGIARFLGAHGIAVHEVTRPERSTRRRIGKSDTIDAEAAARAVITGRALAIPKSRDGAVEAVRVLCVARRSAVRARTQASNQIVALIGASPDSLRSELRALRVRARIDVCSGFAATDTIDPIDATRHALRVLAQRWQHLDDEIARLDTHLAVAVPHAAGTLLDIYGVGINTAATLLVTAGDNPDRMHSEAAFAALCGVNPIPASSGKTTRHRLNRGGDRHANSALWRIAMVRLSHHQPTRDFAHQRAQTGKTKPEIIRILKRYIAREVYPHLRASLDR